MGSRWTGSRECARRGGPSGPGSPAWLGNWLQCWRLTCCQTKRALRVAGPQFAHLESGTIMKTPSEGYQRVEQLYIKCLVQPPRQSTGRVRASHLVGLGDWLGRAHHGRAWTLIHSSWGLPGTQFQGDTQGLCWGLMTGTPEVCSWCPCVRAHPEDGLWHWKTEPREEGTV